VVHTKVASKDNM